MFKKKDPEVLVAGAGPAGLIAALTLARRGVRVQIADAEREAAAHSYALALHPETLRLFERLELLPEVLNDCYRINTIGLYEGADRRSELSYSALSGDCPFLAVMPQNLLESMLERKLAEHDVKVKWSHRVTRFTPEDDAVNATVDKLVTESMGYAVAHTSRVVARSHDMRPAFLIGADGHHSLVRRAMGLGFDEVGPAQNFAVFECWSSADLKNEMRVVLNEKDTNVLWPLPEGRLRWSFELPDFDPESSRLVKGRVFMGLGSSRFPVLETTALGELIEERAPWFQGEIDDIAWRSVVRFERRLASSFGEGRVWLVGDAGHMTGPVGAQSMNAGIREAYQLSGIMADILKEGAPTESLEEYGRQRREEWSGLLGVERQLAAGDATDPWIRSRADRILPCLPATGSDLEQLAGQCALTVPIAC